MRREGSGEETFKVTELTVKSGVGRGQGGKVRIEKMEVTFVSKECGKDYEGKARRQARQKVVWGPLSVTPVIGKYGESAQVHCQPGPYTEILSQQSKI